MKHRIFIAVAILITALLWMLWDISVGDKHQSSQAAARDRAASSTVSTLIKTTAPVNVISGPSEAVIPPIVEPSGTPVPEQAYRFRESGTDLIFEGISEFTAYSQPLRGKIQWAPGMLYIRLVDKNEAVLAHKTLAGNFNCAVLDPTTIDADGKPTVGHFSPAEQKSFDVRFAKTDKAIHIDVFKVDDQSASSIDPPSARLVRRFMLQTK